MSDTEPKKSGESPEEQTNPPNEVSSEGLLENWDILNKSALNNARRVLFNTTMGGSFSSDVRITGIFCQIQTGNSKLNDTNSDTVGKELRFSKREVKLLRVINNNTLEVQPRLAELDAKRRAETLTPKEHKELLVLLEANEKTQAERLSALLKLAQLRGVSLDELMEQLGLSAPPPVYG